MEDTGEPAGERGLREAAAEATAGGFEGRRELEEQENDQED